MKTVFISINSKYSHTLLAPRYLTAGCKHDVEIFETNINVPIQNVLAEVCQKQPNVVAFSTYVFNARYVADFIKEIKIILPNIIIVLGGWEVAFNSQAFPEADYILRGEGDFEFGKLLSDIETGKQRERIIECGTVATLDDIPSPYTDEYARLGKDKILYFESARGCPYSCAYCMSSKTQKVRFFSLNRVFSDLDRVVKYHPKYLKFIDRTFNCNLDRTKKIMSYIKEKYTGYGTSFHFEVAPELFDEELFEIIMTAEKGLFQFEIGVQSYNQKTLTSVKRRANLALVDENIKRLTSFGNCHVHVDLIAGLPNEDIISFANGFDRLMSLKPHVLQLGFLKILKGSELEQTEGYSVSTLPPYEIYSSPNMTYCQLVRLKQIEEMLEVFYNSGKFKSSIRFLLEIISPFKLFGLIADYFSQKNIDAKLLSFYHRCDELFLFANEMLKGDEIENFSTLLEQDYIDGGNVRKWRKPPFITQKQ